MRYKILHGTMYSKCTGNEIFLWCDVSCDDSASGGRNSESGGSRRKEKEDAVESIFQELLTEHMDSYSKPQLKNDSIVVALTMTIQYLPEFH